MDLPQLRCFLAVAEELHFGKAAARLHLTPSPVSRMVKELERELGVDLFVRRYHNVQLTPLGVALFDHVYSIVQEVDQLKSIADDFKDTNQIIRIGGTHLAPPRLLDQFVDLVDKVVSPNSVDLVVAQSSDLLPGLESGEIQAVMVHLPTDNPGIDSVVVEKYSLFVAMRADDPLSNFSELALADLTQRVLTIQPVTSQPVVMNRLRRRFTELGVTNFHQMENYDPVLLASHIRRSHGITISLHPSTGGAASVFSDSTFSVVPLRDDLGLFVGVAWSKKAAEKSPILRNIVAAVQDVWTLREVPTE